MGLTEISVSPTVIPEVKKIIRSVTYDETKELADKVLAMDNVAETTRLLHQKVKEIIPEVV